MGLLYDLVQDSLTVVLDEPIERGKRLGPITSFFEDALVLALIGAGVRDGNYLTFKLHHTAYHGSIIVLKKVQWGNEFRNKGFQERSRITKGPFW